MVSIIIPTRNRLKSLLLTINSILLGSVENENFEIIVVDNGSDEYSFEELKTKIMHPNVKFILESKVGLVYARNCGFKNSQGNILAFIDDDIIVGDRWLVMLLELNTAYLDVNLFTGCSFPIYQIYPESWINNFWSYDREHKIRHCYSLSLIDFGESSKYIDPNYVWGLNFIIRRSSLITYFGFNPDVTSSDRLGFVGDGESGLTNKMKLAGEQALYLPDLCIHHIASKERLTHEYFIKRAYIQGISDSFTDIRSQQGLQSNKIKLNRFRQILNSLKFILSKKIIHRSQFKFLKEFEEAKLQGYQFHQNLYRNNQEIFDWVNKENYFD
jgi:glycosyltransferase involved in cell wall biosynthesis